MAERFILWILHIFIGLLVLMGGCSKEPGQVMFRSGLRSFNKQNYQTSIQFFEKALSEKQEFKENPFLYNYLGIAYYHTKEFDRAEEAFEKSIQLDPELVEPVYNLATLLVKEEKQNEAIQWFKKAAVLDSKETRALEYLAFLYGQWKQWEEARSALQDAFERAPHSPRIITELALFYLQQDKAEQCVLSLQQALEFDSSYLPAIYNLAVVNSLWLNNRKEAIAYFKEYLRFSSPGYYTDKARQALVNLYHHKPITADILSASVVTTHQAFLQSSELTSPQAKKKSAPAPVKRRFFHWRMPSEKRPALKSQPATNKEKFAILPDAKLSAFDRTMRIAYLLEEQGRDEAAVNNYIRAANQAEGTEKGKKQEQALRKAVSLCTTNARTYYTVGMYYRQHNQYNTAVNYLKKAIALNSSFYDGHMALSEASIKVKEFDTAILCLKQADKLKPDNSKALWLLADVYDTYLGLTNMAFSCYNSFIKRFPADSHAKQARERLKSLKHVKK